MNKQKSTARIDWMITLVPLALILALCVLFFFLPEQSNAVLSQIRLRLRQGRVLRNGHRRLVGQGRKRQAARQQRQNQQ